MNATLESKATLTPNQMKGLCDKYGLGYPEAIDKFLKNGGVGLSKQEAVLATQMLTAIPIQILQGASKDDISLAIQSGELAVKAYAAYRSILNGESNMFRTRYSNGAETDNTTNQLIQNLEFRLYKGIANLAMVATLNGTLAQSRKVAEMTVAANNCVYTY